MGLASRFIAAGALAVVGTPALAQYVTPGAPLTMNSLASFLNTAFSEVAHANCISGVNFNSGNTDSTIAINFPSGRTRFKLEAVYIDHASTTITTATAGLFTATAGAGSTLSTTQALTVTGSTGGVDNGLQVLTLSTHTLTSFYTSTAIFFRVGTAQGAAATADVCVYYRSLP